MAANWASRFVVAAASWPSQEGLHARQPRPWAAKRRTVATGSPSATLMASSALGSSRWCRAAAATGVPVIAMVPRRFSAPTIIDAMERVVVLGRGAAGKSTAAVQLGRLTGLPVIELDRHCWSAELESTSPEEWSRQQLQLTGAKRWILDGDLGPYDVLAPRLARPDTVVVVVFDFSLARCAWRALRRSRERCDFWWWLLTWRGRIRGAVHDAVAEHAPGASLRVVRTPRDLRRLLSEAAPPTSGRQGARRDPVAGSSTAPQWAMSQWASNSDGRQPVTTTPRCGRPVLAAATGSGW